MYVMTYDNTNHDKSCTLNPTTCQVLCQVCFTNEINDWRDTLHDTIGLFSKSLTEDFSTVFPQREFFEKFLEFFTIVSNKE